MQKRPIKVGKKALEETRTGRFHMKRNQIGARFGDEWVSNGVAVLKLVESLAVPLQCRGL
jgi:hypothetical protein